MGKLKTIFSNKRFLVILVSLTTLLIVLGVVFLIYSKDRPKFIPEETRGEVREVIKENIAGAVEKVSPKVAEAIRSVAYPVNIISNSSTNNQNTDSTANWPTYKNEEFGFELKYPEGWVVYKEENKKVTFAKSTDVEILNRLRGEHLDTDVPYWGGKAIYLEKISMQDGLINFINYQFGTEGVDVTEIVINGKNFYYVVDESPDRFGGGKGYYYFFETENGENFEIGLDFFLNQETNNELIKNLEKTIKTVKE